MAPIADSLYDVAFIAADQLWTSDWTPGGHERERAVDLIATGLRCSPATARNAFQAVDLGRMLSVEKVGTPTVEQLMWIVWARVQGPQARGWGMVDAWMVRKGFTFENVTRPAIEDYCARVKKQLKDEKVQRADATLPADPYDPPDAVVADDRAEEVDGEIVGPAPRPRTPLNTTEQAADVRLARAIEAFERLMEDGTSMLNNIKDFDRSPEWLRLRASDFRRTVEAVERLKPIMDAALRDADATWLEAA
jgi:hypothetical protein